ncbi:hypothetical protein [Actinomadura sp. NEAU-AAG7]|uniref:hypothetical protein n=1 Tax=Actinomadura sp. NEAU-AAG7 TaxID=2839640 RepID=UPI001BE4C4AF|nr:hypothetical protein [Actinomadura sp. NEAU-AAG7]MBT2212498.1 hypothetical protein [Actinomadura sp. NEAU-AAG7]
MRATAKWILAASAAVGAALLGGGPLTAAGKVHGFADAALAYTGLVIGLLGVGWAIWHTADALIPPLTLPSSLDQEPQLKGLRERIAREPGAFYGPYGTSVADLRTALAFHRTVAANLAAALATEQDPARREVISAKIEQARTAVEMIQQRSRGVMELTHAWHVRAQLRRARFHTMLGAAVTALGAVVFLAATGNAPAHGPKPAGGAAPLVTRAHLVSNAPASKPVRAVSAVQVSVSHR